MTLVFTKDFEEGTLNAALTTATNPGATIATGATYIAETAPGHGSLQARVVGSGGGNISYAVVSTTAATYSVYVTLDTVAATSAGRIISIMVNPSTVLVSLRRHNDGKIDIIGSAQTRLQATAGTFAAGARIRIDLSYSVSGSNVLAKARIYADPEGTAYEELQATLTAATPGTVSIGPYIANWTFLYDTLRAYDTAEAWPAPIHPSVPQAGSVAHLWAGAPTPSGFVVTSKTIGCTSVSMLVAEASDMSAPTTFGAVTPDANGYVRLESDSLSANTRYYYQLTDTPPGGSQTPIGNVGTVKTLPQEGVPAQQINIALGACTLYGKQDDSAHADIIAWNPDFIIHTGDFYYTSLTDTTPSSYRALYENMIETYPSHDVLCRDFGWYYCISDHEAGPDNGDSNNDWTVAVRNAYAQVVPHAGSAPDVLYHAWTVGRVRFIMLDCRSADRSPGANTDDSAKTLLGATQKQWLFDELSRDEYLKIIISDVAWQGAPSITNGADKWWSYSNERQQIIDFITTNDVNVEIWCGDSHTIAYTTPEDNAYGGFPVLVSAPLAQTGGGRNLDEFTYYYSAGAVEWNPDGTEEARQYVRITLEDDGSTITRTAVGYDALNDIVRFTDVQTYNDIQAPNTIFLGQNIVAIELNSQRISKIYKGTNLILGSGSTPPVASPTHSIVDLGNSLGNSSDLDADSQVYNDGVTLFIGTTFFLGNTSEQPAPTLPLGWRIKEWRFYSPPHEDGHMVGQLITPMIILNPSDANLGLYWNGGGATWEGDPVTIQSGWNVVVLDEPLVIPQFVSYGDTEDASKTFILGGSIGASGTYYIANANVGSINVQSGSSYLWYGNPWHADQNGVWSYAIDSGKSNAWYGFDVLVDEG